MTVRGKLWWILERCVYFYLPAVDLSLGGLAVKDSLVCFRL